MTGSELSRYQAQYPPLIVCRRRVGMLRVLSLAGTSFVLSCFVLVLIGVPAGAQDSGGIPPGTAATGVDTDNTNSPPDLIDVAASDCTVSPGASITLEDGDYSVVSSTGVTCGGGGTTAADDQYRAGPVDNPKGVMPETVVIRKVPRTGGPPYIPLAAVALLSVALIAGRAVLRP